MKTQFKHLWVLCIAMVLVLSSLMLASCNDTTPAETDADTNTDTTVATDAATQAPVAETQASTNEVTTNAAETQAPVVETQAPVAETQAPAVETQAPETQAPETQAPETQAPETQAATEDPLAKYEFGYGSTMDMSDYDPITNKETVTAPADDANLKLWFDHITEKVARYDISGKDSGKDSYTIQMGKNEMEGCQFFLYYPEQKRITIRLSDFANENGEKLHTELGVEYYIEDGYVDLHAAGQPVYADAVVPYESYISKTDGGSYYEEGAWVTIGPYSPKVWDLENYPYKETSRAFVIQAMTTPDTTPGAYKATLEIVDADTGVCIKMANVYTYVYDVTLSEETALDTSFTIWGWILNQYFRDGVHGSEDVNIYRAVANFLLKYRITPTGSTTMMNILGKDWMLNPRVTTIRVAGKDFYDSIKDDPILSQKMFYYGQDEPGTSRPWDTTGHASIEKLMEEANMLINDWGWTDYRMVSPFELNVNFTKHDSKDQIDFMSRYVNIWCPKFYSFTPRELKGIRGSKFTHSVTQDKKFGEFEARMDKFVAEDGDSLWAYVSCQPTYTAPYQNILLFNDGTEARTMFWTCYELDVTGFLYWHTYNYNDAGTLTYTMRCPFPKEGPGDGILIYAGSAFGQLDPIPSIRLINMREGIEDYQLLTMLEAAKGQAYTDELVHHIVTSTITFNRDDQQIYNVHSYLLRALESAAHAE